MFLVRIVSSCLLIIIISIGRLFFFITKKLILIIAHWHSHNEIRYKYLGQSQINHLKIVKINKYKAFDVFHPDPDIEPDANNSTCKQQYLHSAICILFSIGRLINVSLGGCAAAAAILGAILTNIY